MKRPLKCGDTVRDPKDPDREYLVTATSSYGARLNNGKHYESWDQIIPNYEVLVVSRSGETSWDNLTGRPAADTTFQSAVQECLNERIMKLVAKHCIAVEGLTGSQLAEVIKQACACGDIQKHVMVDGSSQAVTYFPYRRHQEMKSKIEELKKMLDDSRIKV